MQKTIHCNGEGLPNYPRQDSVEIFQTEVYVHDSGMLCQHNYPCPVCRENHAVLRMTTGVMEPCWDCQRKGYELLRLPNKKSLVYKIVHWLLS